MKLTVTTYVMTTDFRLNEFEDAGMRYDHTDTFNPCVLETHSAADFALEMATAALSNYTATDEIRQSYEVLDTDGGEWTFVVSEHNAEEFTLTTYHAIVSMDVVDRRDQIRWDKRIAETIPFDMDNFLAVLKENNMTLDDAVRFIAEVTAEEEKVACQS